MGFVSFVGRVLFAAVFLLSAYQELHFASLDVWWRRLPLISGILGEAWQEALFMLEHAGMNLRFNEFGADGGPAAKAFKPKFYLVSKHLHTHLGFQVPEIEMKHVIAGTIALRGLGGLLFIFGSTLGANLLSLYLAVVTPIVYDFYNYDIEKPQFVQLFVKFTQNLALFGALLFFLGMKDSVPKRASKKKAPKTKSL